MTPRQVPRTARGQSTRLWMLLLALGLGLAACGTSTETADEPVASPGQGGSATALVAEQATATVEPTEVEEGVSIGQRAPDFTLKSLDGQDLSLSDFRGQTVLLNFWATWCPPCREEMPALDHLYRDHRDEGFTVIAVNVGEDATTAGGFVDEGGYTFPVVLDQSSTVSMTYLALGLPTSYFIDPNGIILDYVPGAMTADVMDAKYQRFSAAALGAPAEPRSVVEVAGAANADIVARIGEREITMREVNHRLDMLLALERIDSGAVIDPAREADQAELRQRQSFALDSLLDETLLVDAATEAELTVDPALIDREMDRLAEQAGGADPLRATLAVHGVTPDDVRSLFERGYLAQTFIEQTITPGAGDGQRDAAVQAWLEAEREQRGVERWLPVPEQGG